MSSFEAREKKTDVANTCIIGRATYCITQIFATLNLEKHFQNSLLLKIDSNNPRS